MDNMNVDVLDTTLRDGSQGCGVSFSVQDKINICQALDELGVSFIEAGNPGSNQTDMEFFQTIKKISLRKAKVCAFGSTRRKKIKCAEDANVQSLLSADTEWVVIFGKSWSFQVKDIIKTTLDENLNMIYETCNYFSQRGRHVIFDAEHFFTGYIKDRTYAIKTLKSAIKGGAEVVSLCETMGGCMLKDCKEAVLKVSQLFSKCATIGIHAHNDSGLAVANSLLAVESGARHVQGVFLGFGERTGNANLSTVIADLQLKMGYHCIADENIPLLTPIANRIAEISNIVLDSQMPFVGSSAFSHKAGMHIDAILKNPAAYEHIAPESVGNARVFLMSELAGKSAVFQKMKKIDPTIQRSNHKLDEKIKYILKKIKTEEKNGYSFDGANASVELFILKAMDWKNPFFKICSYVITDVNKFHKSDCVYAQIKMEVKEHPEFAAGEGNGPVDALDKAFRDVLCRYYTELDKMKLLDYKVRILGGDEKTCSKTRVLIESTDGISKWVTAGVSSNIIEASCNALQDSFLYKLVQENRGCISNLFQEYRTVDN
ncbi:MAG: citramalate synthase [Treponema sp.]|nr:citramalate synthase [Treponema sp.]